MVVQQSEVADLRPGWRGAVAHAASPWRWGRVWFALYLVALFALSTAWVVGALTGPTSGVVKVVELLLALVATTFLAIRPARRAIQLRTQRSTL